jgi:phosphoglycolate phosphatase
MLKAVIFDFDGTLTELTLDFGAMRKAVEAIAARYMAPDAVRRLDGLYILEMIDALEGLLDHKGGAFRQEALGVLCRMEVEAASGKEVYPYTRGVLDALRREGLLIGVITRNCTAAVERVFPDIRTCVDAVATRDDVRAVKPEPAHVRAILAALGVEARDALLVGDHPTDMIAGNASGVHTVGLLAGRTARTELERAGAEYIADDIRAVPGIARRLRLSSPADIR